MALTAAIRLSRRVRAGAVAPPVAVHPARRRARARAFRGASPFEGSLALRRAGSDGVRRARSLAPSGARGRRLLAVARAGASPAAGAAEVRRATRVARPFPRRRRTLSRALPGASNRGLSGTRPPARAGTRCARRLDVAVAVATAVALDD